MCGVFMKKDYNIEEIRTFLESHHDAGLSLLFDDGHEVNLTYDTVRVAAKRLEQDLEAIPPDRRAAAEFSPCRVCPARETAIMCHALPAILPFLDALNPYQSYQPLTVVYVGRDTEDGNGVLHMRRTTLQRALQYIAMESVLGYCELGRLYFKYFSGIIPFSSAEAIAERIYANIMLAENGNLAAVSAIIDSMRENLGVTMQCQIKRVRLVSQSDVFVNAFINLHTALELLRPEERSSVRETLAKREAL